MTRDVGDGGLAQAATRSMSRKAETLGVLDKVSSRRSEHDDPTRHLPTAECRKPLVDLAELVGSADQLVDLQTAVQVQVDQLREVDVRAHRAVHRAADGLLLRSEEHTSELQSRQY